jgi:hypothetical protein
MKRPARKAHERSCRHLAHLPALAGSRQRRELEHAEHENACCAWRGSRASVGGAVTPPLAHVGTLRTDHSRDGMAQAQSAARTKKSPPRPKPGGPKEGHLDGRTLLLDAVNALPGLVLRGGTGKSSFLPSVPLMNPRTLWACQERAFTSSANVTPFGRRSRARAWAVLLPSRASPAVLAGFAPLVALGAFLVRLAFFPDFPFAGATLGFRGAAVAFLLGLGCFVSAAGVVADPGWRSLRWWSS